MGMVHGIMHRKGNLNPETWFEMQTGRTRSAADQLQIKKKYGRLELRNQFFSIRVINKWNSIPLELRKLEKPTDFKRGYKKLRATMDLV